MLSAILPLILGVQVGAKILGKKLKEAEAETAQADKPDPAA